MMRRLRFAVAAVILSAATAILVAGVAAGGGPRELRVCADPNNLPFSNDRGEGFENRLAELVARDLGMRLRYTWAAQRRGFVRNTLAAGECDVVMGVPSRYELVRATRPYYRSTYVFVTRESRHLDIASFDDPRLRTLRIGVHVIGDDAANAPPAHALSNRGIIGNLVGYSVYGDYTQPNPPARLIEGVAKGEVDVGVAWGPLAGYFARRQPEPLRIVPVSPAIDLPSLPFVYDISMGVRRDDAVLQDRLDRVILARGDEIDALLDEFDVPDVRRVRRSAGIHSPQARR